MTVTRDRGSVFSGVSVYDEDAAVKDVELSSDAVITVSSISDFRSTVMGGGTNFDDVVFVPGQFSESTTSLIDPHLTQITRDEDFTPDEWEEVKQQVLAKIGASTLDTPEGHLCYIREQLAFANARYV